MRLHKAKAVSINLVGVRLLTER